VPDQSRSNVRRLAAARLISIVGSQAAFTALLYTIYRRTGSPAWVSATLLATFGTIGLLSPLAGALGDRFDRRKVMIASDVLGAVCFASLGLVRSPSSLIALAFLAAAVGSPFFSASSAAIPNLAAPEDLNWANSTISLGASVGHMVGPFLGGVLVAAIGATAVFELNALSFLVSVAIVVSVEGRFSGDRSQSDEHRGLRAGFRFVARDPVLRILTVAFVVFVLSVGGVVVAELPLAQLFRVGSVGYGLMATAWGSGALIGVFRARRLTEATERRAMVGFCFITAAALVSVSLMPVFPPMLLAMLIAGGADAVVDVAAETLIQRRSPDEVRSRVVAAVDGLILTMFATSFLFAGFVVAALGPKAAYAIAGAGCAVTATLLVPVLRNRTGFPLPRTVADPP
jgi:MFS family permease